MNDKVYEDVHNYTKYKLIEMLIERFNNKKLKLDNLNSIEDLADDVLKILSIAGLKFYSYSATQRVRVAIYDDDSNSPNNLLNSSSEYTPLDTTDWQAFTLPDTPLTNTTKYWIAMWSNENMDLYNDSTSGEKVKNSITYSATGAFTDPSADDGTDAGTYNVGVSSVGGQTWVERGTAI